MNFDSGVWRGVFTVLEPAPSPTRWRGQGSAASSTWLDRPAAPLGRSGEQSEAYCPRLSPDGRRASVIQGDPNNDIWIYELERGVRTRLTTDAEATPVAGLVAGRLRDRADVPGARPGTFALLAVSIDGSGEREDRANSTERIEPTDWSRDGRYVLVDPRQHRRHRHLGRARRRPGQGLAARRLSVLETSGQFSPDGRWVAYVSTESGRIEVYVTPFPAGGAHYQVSANGGMQPRWSPDGKTLYFVSVDNELMAVDGAAGRRGSRSRGPACSSPPTSSSAPASGLAGYAVRPTARASSSTARAKREPRVALVDHWDAGLPR